MLGKKALVGMAAAALLAAPMVGMAAASPVVADGGSSNATGWVAVGKWKSKTTYHYGDVVRYKGRTYVATATSKGKKPKGSKKWSLVVSNGSTGPTGPTGPSGANGIHGINGTNGTNGAVGPTGAVGPNLVVKDRAGTTLGVYGGSSSVGGVPLVAVIFEGGVWWYTVLGTYMPGTGRAGLDAQAGGSSGGFFLNDTCTGTPYVGFGSQAQADTYLAGLGGSLFRLIGMGAGDTYFGAMIAPNTPSQPYPSTNIWYWDSGAPGTPGTCEMDKTSANEVIAPLTVVPLPPAAVGGLYLTQP